MSVDDAGPVVAAVFKNPDEFIGQKIGIMADCKTIDECVAVIIQSA